MGKPVVIMVPGVSKLKAWREAQRPPMSQATAADRIGATQAAWWAWERGLRRPELEFVLELVRLTDGEVALKDWVLSPADQEARAARRSGPRDESGPLPESADDEITRSA